MPTLPKQNETALVKACLEYLPLEGVVAWRNNTGALIDRTGRPVRFGLGVGSPDIVGCMPDGRYLAVECKIGKRKLTMPKERLMKNKGDSPFIPSGPLFDAGEAGQGLAERGRAGLGEAQHGRRGE